MLVFRITQIRRKSLSLFTFSFYFKAFASPAGGLRNCNAAAFASFKKFAAHFLNLAFGETDPKEAAYAVTVLKRNNTHTEGRLFISSFESN